MNCFFKILAITTLGICSQAVLAVPAFLVTHNHTDVESNAFINGTVKSPYPTSAHQDRSVSWTAVRIACTPEKVKCKALIKMATNTANAVDLGWLELDLASGDINPKFVQGNGYTLIVNGPAEVTLSKE
ncbi:MAG: hypothetical protein A3F46_10295 [Legionellales bacterium RIFCSPHIGHO2_12_FULL_42_9]|nr:MAG: hypothetical protein A3F46_10295 [Legionellales bacterium RIFCSPHIGHO2_12_FULL_42_9]